MTTEVEQLREQIREGVAELKSREASEQSTIAQGATAEATASSEPLEMANLVLWATILVVVLVSLAWLTVWALLRALRGLVRGTSAAWHEGQEQSR